MRFSCGRQPGSCCYPRRCRVFDRRRPQLAADESLLCCLAMTRRCSHCSHNGHNARTCPNRGFRLFGVRLTDQPTTTKRSSSLSVSSPDQSQSGDGYVSDGPVQATPSAVSSHERERKKGVPWTEEEHRLFLIGLEKLGKGDWRGISREYVRSRTPTQVASHAQKHFIRQSNLSKRKRRSSLFDISTKHQGNADEKLDHQLSLRPPGRGSSLQPPPPPRQRANKDTAWLTLGISSTAAANTNTGGSSSLSLRANPGAVERALIRVS